MPVAVGKGRKNLATQASLNVVVRGEKGLQQISSMPRLTQSARGLSGIQSDLSQRRKWQAVRRVEDELAEPEGHLVRTLDLAPGSRLLCMLDRVLPCFPFNQMHRDFQNIRVGLTLQQAAKSQVHRPKSHRVHPGADDLGNGGVLSFVV